MKKLFLLQDTTAIALVSCNDDEDDNQSINTQKDRDAIKSLFSSILGEYNNFSSTWIAFHKPVGIDNFFQGKWVADS